MLKNEKCLQYVKSNMNLKKKIVTTKKCAQYNMKHKHRPTRNTKGKGLS